MPLPSRLAREAPPPDPHGLRDVIARRREVAENDRDRLRAFELACATARDDLRRTTRNLESTARHRHAAQLESLTDALKRACEVPATFSPALIAVRWLWRTLMEAKRMEEAAELGAHASAMETRETRRHLATVDGDNAARLAALCVRHAGEMSALVGKLADCEKELARTNAALGRKLTRPGVGKGEVKAGAAAACEDGKKASRTAESRAEDVAGKSSKAFASTLMAIGTHVTRQLEAREATYAAKLPRDVDTGEIDWLAMPKPNASVMRANGVDRGKEAEKTLRRVMADAAAGRSLRAEEAARDARRRYRLERLSAGQGGAGAAASGATDDELITDAEHRRRVRERAAVDARWLDPTDEAEGIVPMCPEDEFNPVDGGGVMKVAAPANASRRVLSRKLVDFADRRDVYHRGFGVGKIVATTAAIEAHADDDDDGERLEISGNDENDDASSGDESDDGGCPRTMVDERLERRLRKRRMGMVLPPPPTVPLVRRPDNIKPRSSFNLLPKGRKRR